MAAGTPIIASEVWRQCLCGAKLHQIQHFHKPGAIFIAHNAHDFPPGPTAITAQ